MAKKTPSKPSKNSDGQEKQPAANPTGGPSAAPGGPPQGVPGQAPSLVPPGGPPAMHQIQQRINFKDMPPMAQAQTEEQLGINPAAPLQMIQGQLASSMQEPQGGPVPASFIGPMTPPGVENFPHDYAALMQVMQRGYSPGASAAEHQMAMNAHSMVRMGEQHAQNMAAQQAAPPGPPGMPPQGGPPGLQQALGNVVNQVAQNGQAPPPNAPGAQQADEQRRRALAQLQSGY